MGVLHSNILASVKHELSKGTWEIQCEKQNQQLLRKRRNGRWSYMIAGYALNEKDEEDSNFTFSTVLLICANITTYDQGKQVHILTKKYGFDSYDFVGIYLVGISAKCGFVSSFVHSFWASCQNSHELTVQS